MTDQPYDPYQQQPREEWPAQQPYQGYDDPYAAQQHTQQWQGQTWETQVHAPVQTPGAAPYPPAERGEASQQHGAPEWQQQAHYPQHQAPQPPQQWHQQAHEGQGYEGYAAQGGHAASAAHPGAAQADPGGYQAQAAAQMAGAPAAHAPAHPAGAPGADPGYGPATLSGNARITDAQRARLEGRSPIIEPGMQPAALTALLGLLLSSTAAIGSYALLLPLVVLQAVTAAGWFRLNGMWPARQGIALAFLGALVADAALLAAGREHGPAAILGTLGVWVLLSLVLQLRSHADPDERMYGLMATVASAALSILAAGYLAADTDAVSVGAAAVAVALLARALPLPTPASLVVALLAAAGAGIAVGGMTGFGTKGALLGAAASLCALIGHRVASYDYPSKFVHFTAGVALPLTAAAPAVYVLGRALG
ncbi:hypothetical protein [Streptomyces sp. NPDC005799]|uniref:hypothetical protein n=1 Tax=Streptomyces sp. NPDC005799 TaxID=3154678 RepID=UPI0033F0AAC6